ncbi:D-lactaldehyde dehydrogenase [Coprinellus micaceus]|uniref:D-lactaldehyde dehydrogenase n=1 Tax=Coprinellus micaceus TaxID=71717 RepID=A0A4Y7SY89_COPMI|nr:D-lactaldehyde dehydrogenase [Coprinellus micaceus]
MPALPSTNPNPTILITGANGYIGTWAVKTTLERGYSVRAVVRTESKSASLRELFGNYIEKGKLEFKYVEDLTKDGAYDEVVKDVDAILHIASPLPTQSSDPQDTIPPAVEGTLGMLQSALKTGNNVKRVVITSSTAAVVTNDLEEARTFTEADWNERVIKQVEEGGSNVHFFLFYRASKILAEKAAWNFYNTNKSSIGWDMTTINPPYVYGPSLEPHIASPSSIGGTQQLWWNQVVDIPSEGLTKEALGIKGGNTWVDVRDLAEAHVRALEREGAGGERIIVSGWIDTVNALASPAIQPVLPKGYPELASGEIPYHIRVDTSKGERLLGLKYRTKEDMVRDIWADVERRGWSEGLVKKGSVAGL